MRRIASAVLVALLTPVAVQAQEDTVPARPFVQGGVYDKPYLAQLSGRLALGGYTEFHARYQRVEGISESSFVPMRFNLFAAARVSDLVRFAAELEFEEGTEEIKLEFAAIDFTIHRALAVRAGMLLSPVGRFNLSHDSPLNDFTDRPLVSTEVFGVALSEPGLGALGAFVLGSRGRLTYEAYLVNGFHDGLIAASAEGTRVPKGRGNIEDNNSAPAVVGRVAWSPSLALEIGVSAHHGAYNESVRDGTPIDDRRNVSLLAVDLDATVGGFRLSGEAGIARIDVPPSLVGINASRQTGWYLDALYDVGLGWIRTLPQSFFTVGARVDVIDLDTNLPGDNTRQLTLGVNFRPSAETAFKFNYVRGHLRDRFNTPEGLARLLFSVATYF
jgi:phosphate-selective porin